MFAGHDTVIAQLVADRRLVDERNLALALDEHRQNGRPLAGLLLESGLVERTALLAAVAAHVGGEALPEPPATLPSEALPAIDRRLARTYGVAPLCGDESSISLLAVDPFDCRLTDELPFALGRTVRLLVADPARVQALIRQHYGDDDGGTIPARESSGRTTSDHLSEADIEELAGRAPVIQLVNMVLSRAIRDGASDVHFEPFEHEFKIRLRIDGALEELPPRPRSLALPVISRLKVLSHLNIAERRLPQDGRVRLTMGGRAVDLRISTLPTQFGESVVLRVLDQAAVRLALRELGLPAPIEIAVRRVIRRPHGLFVVTGPTGSGKTTTLYSCLQLLNVTASKVLTVEDPVEYEIDGIMQVPVNPAAGLTFASALRSFLRQDPDVVMVGEIRDLETAQIAIQASLTGHLVLATLHTNDAAGAVTRLADMGVEPYLLGSTLEAVLAQRLVRHICPECRISRRATPAELDELGMSAATADNQAIWHGAGCPACHGTGYRGRRGIFELLALDDALRDLIAAGVPLEQLRKEARNRGLIPLRDAGRALVLAGQTTLEELARYT